MLLGNRTCLGLFRCQKSTTCLSHDDVCNGITQCPYGDDELACNITCPDTCNCEGLIITCQHNQLENLMQKVSMYSRKLDFSNSRFSDNKVVIQQFPYLAELVLYNCNIEHVNSYSFEHLKNLILLDLSHNRFTVLYKYTFAGLRRLVTLNLTGNYFLTQIEPNTFMSLVCVKNLQLTGTKIETVQDFTFNGLDKLKNLNISGNALHSIENNGFHGLDNLLSIDMSHNRITDFSLEIFSSLENLLHMRSDNYILCCLKPDSVLKENCYPSMDEFSSCTDLMRFDVLRISLWLIGITALIGNTGVIVYRVIYDRRHIRKAHGFYIMNLGFSDMIMGIYLCIIAVADIYFKGDYILHDKQWRQSVTCKIAGVIAAISCEASVNFILLITIDCFLMVKFPFGNRRISIRMARVSAMICWATVILLGIIPITYEAYFSDSYYSKTAVCLALPFSREKISGWEYSAVIFVFYNCFAFFIIACCQFSVYNAAKSSNRSMTKRTRNDLALARRLFLIVFTDFMCWFPVGVMGMYFIESFCFCFCHMIASFIILKIMQVYKTTCPLHLHLS